MKSTRTPVDPRTLMGPALDWVINEVDEDGDDPCPRFSTDWSAGGPVIEREGIELSATEGGWWAEVGARDRYGCAPGPTPLVAAMRALVASRVGRGKPVLVPVELLGGAE